MSISLVLIGIISVIVVAGTAYLLTTKNEELTQKKKSMIMLIVGSVIFVSFIVTSMKHPNKHQNDSSISLNQELNRIFFHENCKYDIEKRYSDVNLPKQIMKQVYDRNYFDFDTQPSLFQSKHQNVLIQSNKDQGSSYFLSLLASNICNNLHPSLYVKLQDKISNEHNFVQSLGFNSYQHLKTLICHLSGIQIKITGLLSEYIVKSTTNKNPYIIIDNYQHLIDALSTQTHYIQQTAQEDSVTHRKYTTKQRLIFKIINQLMGKCKANLIFNSQDDEAIEKLYQIWEENSRQEQIKYFPFQFHLWEGMRHYDIYKIVIRIIQNSDYTVSQILQNNKKDTYKFNDLFNILKQVQLTMAKNKGEIINFKRQDVTLKQANIKVSVARYFGLEKIYKQVRSAQTKTISYFRQKTNLRQLFKLEKLNLISIRNGRIYIQ